MTAGTLGSKSACARCGNFMAADRIEARCPTCERRVGSLPWDRERSPRSFWQTVQGVTSDEQVVASRLKADGDEAPLPWSFAAIALSLASLGAIAMVSLVLAWQRYQVASAFGAENLVLTSLSIEAGRIVVSIPLSLAARTVVVAPLLLLAPHVGGASLSARSALRTALYATAFLAYATVPVMGLTALVLGPRFLMRIAGLDRSVPFMFALAALLYAVFFAVSWSVGLLVEFTMGPALNELSLDILMALRAQATP